MVEIRLTQGYTAIVDDEDGDLAAFKWCATVKGGGRRPYAVGRMGRPVRSLVYLHRVILERMTGRPVPPGMESDHANGKTLDNRRCNLRVATKTQNRANGRKRDNTESRFRGIYRNGKNGWAAHVWLKGKDRYLGTFRTQEEAARAYNEAAIKEYGEFAKLNDV